MPLSWQSSIMVGCIITQKLTDLDTVEFACSLIRWANLLASGPDSWWKFYKLGEDVCPSCSTPVDYKYIHEPVLY